MTVYLDLVILLNFLVDFFLLMGTNRLCGYPSFSWKIVAAAAVGSLYGAVCFLPGLRFLGNTLWRIISLLIIARIAFGGRGAWRRGAVFVLLSMALGGIALGMGKGGFWSLLLSAGGVVILCTAGLRDRIGSKVLLPVEIIHKGKQIRLTALYDTGNTLRDPVTGRSVLVVGGREAQQLTGLTSQQLRDPVGVMTVAGTSGLRLIPYRAVGQPGGFLLAAHIKEVKIGKRKGSSLVAFAPDCLDPEGGYQALTGGMV